MSFGFSKSGAELKTRLPSESMENLAASAPPLRAHVTVSLAVSCETAVVFSVIDLLEVVSPGEPEGPVIRGLFSSTSVMVVVTV